MNEQPNRNGGDAGVAQSLPKKPKKPESLTQTRTISIAVVDYPPGFLDKMYMVWDATTRLHNGLMYEFFKRDVPPDDPNAKLEPLTKVLGAFPDTVAYRLAITQPRLKRCADVLPSSSLSSMTKDIAAKYARKRRGALQYMNDSIPLAKFPYPLKVTRKEVKLDIDPKDSERFIVEFPLMRHGKGAGCTERVTLRFGNCEDDRNTTGKKKDRKNGHPQMPLLEKLRQGLLSYGAITISANRRRISAKQADAEGLPTRRDSRRNRWVYEPVVGFSVEFPKAAKTARRGMVLVHTDPDLFLVAQVDRHNKWNLNEDHMRREFNMLSPAEIAAIIEEHDRLVQRLREDAKAMDHGSRVKSEALCLKQADRIKNFCFHMARLTFKNTVKKEFAELVFFNGDAHAERTFMPHFPWYIFRERLEYLLASEHIEFTELSPFDYLDCKEDKQFNHTKIYHKLRASKALRTKRDTDITDRTKAEGGLLQ